MQIVERKGDVDAISLTVLRVASSAFIRSAMDNCESGDR
jgi:hypothetical protein